MAEDKDLKAAVMQLPDVVKGFKALKEKFEKFMTGDKEFAELKTMDGKVLYYDGDTPQVGMDIMLVEGDKKIPAPDGDYKTDVGMIVVKGGKIIDLKPPANADEQVAKNKALDEVAKNMVDILNKLETMQSQKEAADKEFTAQKESFTSEISGLNKKVAENEKQVASLKIAVDNQTQTLKEIFELVEKLEKSPAAKSTFRKKDGEQMGGESKNLFEEARKITDRVWQPKN